MFNLKNFFLFLLLISISGCSSIPQNTSNSCSIFNERYFWYKHAKSTEKNGVRQFMFSLLLLKWNPILIG